MKDIFRFKKKQKTIFKLRITTKPIKNVPFSHNVQNKTKNVNSENRFFQVNVADFSILLVYFLGSRRKWNILSNLVLKIVDILVAIFFFKIR